MLLELAWEDLGLVVLDLAWGGLVLAILVQLEAWEVLVLVWADLVLLELEAWEDLVPEA